MMFDDVDDDRVDFLFNLARDRATARITELPLKEQDEVVRIRRLLDLIDASWQAPPAQLDRINDRFMAKLAERQPGHPWLAIGRVQTLGELVLAEGEELPNLPPDSFARLKEDATPMDALLDPGIRTRVVGQAVRQAGVPAARVGEFMLWLNHALARLVRTPGQGQQLFYARRQRGRHAPKQPADE